ncbi:MAG TPA: polyprenyl synthetase family protein [Gemmatimonadaceae bacterium]|nr:polyprenyl synthetase family protein [Gemmatimonadaceae bacterium]
MIASPSPAVVSTMASFEEEFAAERREVGAALEVCARTLVPAEWGAVADAARYAMLGSGKRIRGVLLMAAYRAAGGKGDASPLAAAVEIVHAYSLVHDDLPCMDDDDLRRGRPTVHKKWDVRTATVTGVAMVPLAVRAALDGAQRLGLGDAAASEIAGCLMKAAGGGGMIGGQLLDLQSHGADFGLGDLERIHRGKTGELIAASVRIGGFAAGADARQLASLARFGYDIGLAFQIADDVLDVTSTSDRLGKTAGRDAALGKQTYPALLGVQGALERASALIADACEAVGTPGLQGERLQTLAKFVILRES